MRWCQAEKKCLSADSPCDGAIRIAKDIRVIPRDEEGSSSSHRIVILVCVGLVSAVLAFLVLIGGIVLGIIRWRGRLARREIRNQMEETAHEKKHAPAESMDFYDNVQYDNSSHE